MDQVKNMFGDKLQMAQIKYMLFKIQNIQQSKFQ